MLNSPHTALVNILQRSVGQSPPLLNRIAAAVLLLAVAACGGSGGPSAPVATSLAPATTCQAGQQDNPLCSQDPFYANSWHLENTGPTQLVSAASNQGLAGIDANVKNVHQDGKGRTGKGVTIAVIDDGLELAHEDLTANVLPNRSFNFVTNSNDPTPAPFGAGGSHGTAVAGVAGAKGWNGRGSRGLAPDVSLMGFNLIGNIPKPSGPANVRANSTFLAMGAADLADASIEASFAFGGRASSVDVFNMSYGVAFGAAPAVSDNTESALALRSGVQKLRGGLGAVYIKSAGNGFNRDASALLPNGAQARLSCPASYPAELAAGGGLANSTFVNVDQASCFDSNAENRFGQYSYMVAAIANTGRAASYSSSGASNWITGFAGESGILQAAIIVPDDSGCNAGTNNVANQSGFQAAFPNLAAAQRALANLFGVSSIDPNCNYTGTFNGTSAAAPSVSGVVALMLQANPRLTWQDVGFIMAKTARKVDAGIADGARAVTFTGAGAGSTLLLDRPWQTNSAGFNFQNRYGFGLIDADAATRLAVNYTPPAGRRSTPLAATATMAANVSGTAGNGQYSTASTSVTFANPTAVSGQMRLDIQLANATSADLNPGRVQFELTNNRTGQTSNLMPALTAWYFGGKGFPIVPNSAKLIRLHTNAFYGDQLGDGYTIKATYIRPAGLVGGDIGFTATLTSFSM